MPPDDDKHLTAMLQFLVAHQTPQERHVQERIAAIATHIDHQLLDVVVIDELKETLQKSANDSSSCSRTLRYWK